MLAADSAPRKLWRIASRAMSGNAGGRELAELTAAAQVPVTTGRRIAVTSVRGGSGKSAVAALLGSLFAARRADPVLAADGDPDHGSLPWRLGLTQHPSLAQLAPRLLAARGGDLHGLDQLLPRTGAGLWVLPGGVAGQPGLVCDVTRALSRLFAVCVTDCGNMDSAATERVLAEAHSVVVVSPATPDGVRSTYLSLGRLATSQPNALSHLVVVLNATSPDGRAALRERAALEVFGRLGLPVVALPYDRHVAGGAKIVPSQIGEETLAETTRLAAHTLARARRL